MKILAVIESLGLGGAERLLVSLLPELRKLGIDCDLAVLWPPETLKSEFEGKGFRVFSLNVKHRWAFPEVLLKLGKILRQGKYDGIWGHLFFGNLYSLWIKGFFQELHSVVTLHSPGYIADPPGGHWYKMRKKLDEMTVKALADRIVAVSSALAKDYSISCGWQDIRVIHNGISLENLPVALFCDEKRKIREKFGVGEKDFLLVFPGRFSPEKGHDVLLSALKEIKDQGLVVPLCLAIGQGPEGNRLETRAKELGLSGRIRFHGELDQQKLFRLVQSADALVMPSLHEAFGIAAAEGMAMGIPAILSKVDGLVELGGEGENALWANPGDSRSLAEAINRMMNDEELRKRLGENGLRRIRVNFSADLVAQKWAKVFRELSSS